MDQKNKRKHLELIQNVITRMAGNLLYLKGWSITLIAAFFALATNNSEPNYLLAALTLIIILWLLDAYFLSQERLFRALYNAVRTKDEPVIDFSMDTRRYYKRNRTWSAAFFAKILLIFYGGISLIIAVLLFFKY